LLEGIGFLAYRAMAFLCGFAIGFRTCTARAIEFEKRMRKRKRKKRKKGDLAPYGVPVLVEPVDQRIAGFLGVRCRIACNDQLG